MANVPRDDGFLSRRAASWRTCKGSLTPEWSSEKGHSGSPWPARPSTTGCMPWALLIRCVGECAGREPVGPLPRGLPFRDSCMSPAWRHENHRERDQSDCGEQRDDDLTARSSWLVFALWQHTNPRPTIVPFPAAPSSGAFLGQCRPPQWRCLRRGHGSWPGLRKYLLNRLGLP